jgi:hypothetical protein
MFEAVTLIQTKKIRPFPVILAGESSFWEGLLNWINDTLVAKGKVRPEEVAVLSMAKDPVEVLKILHSTEVPEKEG